MSGGEIPLNLFNHEKIKKMKKFNRNNCESCVRAVIVDKWGRKITLLGQHAFEWQIAIEGATGNMTIQSYPNGAKARQVFQELKKKR